IRIRHHPLESHHLARMRIDAGLAYRHRWFVIGIGIRWRNRPQHPRSEPILRGGRKVRTWRWRTVGWTILAGLLEALQEAGKPGRIRSRFLFVIYPQRRRVYDDATCPSARSLGVVSTQPVIDQIEERKVVTLPEKLPLRPGWQP